MTPWYLLYTKPREDERAQTHLLNQGYQILRPLLRYHRLSKGVQKTVTESLFPRYIFIQLDQESSNWARLRSTRGVSSLVSFNQQPAQVPAQLIAELLAQMDAQHVIDRTRVQKGLFQAGDAVEITDGSFYGLQAIVQEQRSTERVVVLLTMLGRQQALEMPLGALKLL